MRDGDGLGEIISINHWRSFHQTFKQQEERKIRREMRLLQLEVMGSSSKRVEVL